jgi:hypothetical protein
VERLNAYSDILIPSGAFSMRINHINVQRIFIKLPLAKEVVRQEKIFEAGYRL